MPLFKRSTRRIRKTPPLMHDPRELPRPMREMADPRDPRELPRPEKRGGKSRKSRKSKKRYMRM